LDTLNHLVREINRLLFSKAFIVQQLKNFSAKIHYFKKNSLTNINMFYQWNNLVFIAN